ncbi:MAG: 2-dehydropantoate 2-reductase N-terminal domain-containing protein [Acidobacteriota bacterium]|nr:2-dehydropantoate 2-reductase N-terminal domain-containing protein [Acidobacteriota bacterium]
MRSGESKEQRPWPRVIVVGPGGVGGYFGGHLARAGARVTMLGREGAPSAHLEAMTARGLRLNTLSFDESVSVETTTAAQQVAHADLILFCVKTTDTDSAAERIARALEPLADGPHGRGEEAHQASSLDAASSGSACVSRSWR